MRDDRLMLLALLSGKVRYEPWPDSEHGVRGEVCVNGIRHVVHSKKSGLPDIGNHLRGELLKVIGK